MENNENKARRDISSEEGMFEQLVEQVQRRNLRLHWYKDELDRIKESLKKEEIEKKNLIQELISLIAEKDEITSEKIAFAEFALSVVREELYNLQKHEEDSPNGHVRSVFLELFNYPKWLLMRLIFFIRTKNKALLLPTPKAFWSDWYRFQYADVEESSIEPYFHYVMYGWKENRTPNPLFDGSYYLKQNPDIVAADVNPFTHYLRNGWKEGRNPGPFFDALWYLSNYQDVFKAKIEPLEHYSCHGWRERRMPTKDFKIRSFFKYYPHFKKPGWSNFGFLKYFLIEELHEVVDKHLNRKGERDSQKDNFLIQPVLSFNRHKILFVGHDAFRAGSQIVLLYLLRWLKKHTNLDIYVFLIAGGALTQDFKEIGPTMVLSEVAGKTEQEIQSQLKEFCGGDPDLIYCNTAVIAKHLDLLPWKKIPIVFHIHELENIIEKLVGIKKFDQAKELVTRYIAVSLPVKQNLVENHEIEGHKVDLVFPFIAPQPVSTNSSDVQSMRRSLGLKENEIIIFGCGTVDHRKGVDIFIEIAIRLSNMGHRDFHFYWIGSQMSGSERLLKEFPKKKLDKYVTFLGEKDNPREFFAAGDIFLLPSREDPFPLVCLEAAECGLPIICFDEAGGIPAFVETDAGFVTPYLNTPAMAEKVSELIKKKDLREQLGAHGKEKVQQRHIVDVIAPRILEIIQDTTGIKPMVSVIVPCFNHANFLPKRLDSIFNQTFRDFEVILLDDASNDSTRDILKRYIGKPNVSVEINTENSGSTFAQWIKGIRKARGEIIWIAEDDDYCEYDFLAKLLPFFNDSEVKLAYSQSYAVDENGQRLFSYENHTHEFSSTRWREAYLVKADEEVNAGLAITNTIPNASAVLFRPFVLDEWYKLSETMQLAGDWLFYLFAAYAGKVAFLPEHLNYHRRHANTNIHRTQFSERRFREIVLTQRFVIERYQIENETRQRMKEYTRRVWDSIYPDRRDEFEIEYNKLMKSPTS